VPQTRSFARDERARFGDQGGNENAAGGGEQPPTANAGAISGGQALTASNLLQGQSKKFFRTLNELAEQADAAVRLAAGNAG
jgi:hypothetical protein